MATKIKLTCTACGGEVIYDKEKPADDHGAHSRLHTEACEYRKNVSMSYIAEHGVPVESEVLA